MDMWVYKDQKPELSLYLTWKKTTHHFAENYLVSQNTGYHKARHGIIARLALQHINTYTLHSEAGFQASLSVVKANIMCVLARPGTMTNMRSSGEVCLGICDLGRLMTFNPQRNWREKLAKTLVKSCHNFHYVRSLNVFSASHDSGAWNQAMEN